MGADPDQKYVHRTQRVAYGAIALAPLTGALVSYLFGVFFTKTPNAGLHIYLGPLQMAAFGLLHAVFAVILFRLCARLFENGTGRDSLGMLFKYIALTNLLLIGSGAVILGTAVVLTAGGAGLAVGTLYGPLLFFSIGGFVIVPGTVIGCFFYSYLRARRLLA